jgi:CheY-like chemotaxis protein
VEPVIEQPRPLLIVDDDPAIRRLLEALLASAGHQVVTAADGPHALEIVRSRRPRAVFLDVTLPEMSGWDVLTHILAIPDPPAVVLLTADSAAVRRAERSGADAAILKPFDIDEVLELAARLLAD